MALGSGSGRRCRTGLSTTPSGATTHLGLEVVQRLVGGHGRGLAGGGSELAGLGGVAEDDGGAHGAGVLAVVNGVLATDACVKPSSAASSQGAQRIHTRGFLSGVTALEPVALRTCFSRGTLVSLLPPH